MLYMKYYKKFNPHQQIFFFLHKNYYFCHLFFDFEISLNFLNVKKT